MELIVIVMKTAIGLKLEMVYVILNVTPIVVNTMHLTAIVMKITFVYIPRLVMTHVILHAKLKAATLIRKIVDVLPAVTRLS